MYGCKSWTMKKAECQRRDAFELWCWRRLLRVPWTARRSNKSILKEINSEYSLEWLMLKLKLQFFGHLMWRANSLEKPRSGKVWGQEEKGATEDKMVGWHDWLNGHEFEQTPRDSKGQGGPVCCSPWGHKVRHALAIEQQKSLNMELHHYFLFINIISPPLPIYCVKLLIQISLDICIQTTKN